MDGQTDGQTDESAVAGTALAKRRAVKRQRHNSPGLSEMMQATEGIRTQWLLDLCNGIVTFYRLTTRLLEECLWNGAYV